MAMLTKYAHDFGRNEQDGALDRAELKAMGKWAGARLSKLVRAMMASRKSQNPFKIPRK
jgi:hypothetical protein